jgi:hypothetical protein
MITLSIPIRNGRLAVIGNALDSGVAGGLLRIYSAPRPDIGEVLTEQILLVEIRLPKPSVWSLDVGKLTFAPIGEALCRRSATAAWARLADGDERWVADLDVGLEGSGAEVELSKLQLFAGGAVNVNLAEISE